MHVVGFGLKKLIRNSILFKQFSQIKIRTNSIVLSFFFFFAVSFFYDQFAVGFEYPI